MKNKNNERGTIQQKKEDLWNKMLILRDLAIDPDDEIIDGAIRELYQEDPPTWLTNSLVFSSFFAVLDRHIHRELEKMSNTKQNILFKLKSNKKTREEIQTFNDEIKRLKQIVKVETEGPETVTDSDINMQIEESDRVYKQKYQKLHLLEEEEEELEIELEKCEKEYNNAKIEGESYRKHLVESAKTIKQYRMKNNELEQFVKNIIKHRNLLHKREKELIVLVDSLVKTRVDNEKKLKQLEEKYGKHKHITQCIKDAENRIRALQQQQELSVTKMIESVRSCELAKVEAKKQSTINSKMSDEVLRINELSKEKSKQLTIILDSHVSTIHHNLERIYNELLGRVNEILSQNQEIVQDKAVVQKRLELSRNENQKLMINKRNNGFNAFLDHLSTIKAECEVVSVKIDQCKLCNMRVTENLSEIKAKILTSSNECKESIQLLQIRADDLTYEIEECRNQYNEVLVQNEELSASNKLLRTKIIETQKDALSEEKRIIQLKNEEIEVQKDDIKVLIDNSSKAIEALTIANQGYKDHADKWRSKLDAINLETNETSAVINQKKEEIIDTKKKIRTQIQAISDANDVSSKHIIEIDKAQILLRNELNDLMKKMNKQMAQIEEYRANTLQLDEENKSIKRKSDILDSKIKQLEVLIDQMHRNQINNANI